MTGEAFSVQQFLANVGERIVMEFSHAAQGTTPTLTGDSREHPARRRLERLLPPAAGVGSGVVIDCEGRTSKQQDIVVYDRSITPVFSINDTPSATYYPVEGVIAVGEVKTRLGRSELKDAFAKVHSVQSLRRSVGPVAEVFRAYGMTGAMHGAPSEAFEQDGKATDQVFGFVLCHELATSSETMTKNAVEFWQSQLSTPGPGAIVALQEGILQPVHEGGRVISVRDADAVHFDADRQSSFARLVETLSWVVLNGRTTSTDAFARYLSVGEAVEARGSRTVPLHWA